ncbi:MAG: tRNA (adenosine(37)-N6)-threonylcarbamoyltransferase complex transferase subunit TsaD ['Conium maculatum' witches'-broom phytoplasma]|nr:tRNA (adenosine(37)-N6)-threonylcarbamoyltransferase complex transferase subunit TsaD ['Conium maculatum' witches'-broom phytoplasma]
MNILSIETSCDETSVAVTQNGKKVLSNVVFSQIDFHKQYGGVVPEIASRKHVETITLILKQALEEAKMTPQEIDLVAVTQGPGLIGSLLLGINAANTFAYIHQKPLIGVNHLMGHLYSAQIENEIKFPALALLISGGHTELIYIEDHFKMKHIGTILDDAVGEVYDKVAKTLQLDYPGGPIIEKLALQGKDIFNYPRPYLKNKNLNFSFSGLKSKIINSIDHQKMSLQYKSDIAASFQVSITEVLVKKTQRAMKIYPTNQLLIVGGVAANQFLINSFKKAFPRTEILTPSLKYCTDQAAMIGIAAYYQNKFSQPAEKKYKLNGNTNLKVV